MLLIILKVFTDFRGPKACLEILNISRNIIYCDLGTALELYQLTNLKVLEISGQDPVGEIYGYPIEFSIAIFKGCPIQINKL
jgi:hypothetical protein